MATTKKGTKRKAKAEAEPQGAAARTQALLKERWEETRDALLKAETRLEKQVRALLKGRRISGAEASAVMKDLQARMRREQKKAARELETRVKSVQHRLEREKKAASQLVDDAVKSALVAFNIPSRQEVAELTRKVDELSKKIDGFRSRRTRPVARTAAAH